MFDIVNGQCPHCKQSIQIQISEISKLKLQNSQMKSLLIQNGIPIPGNIIFDDKGKGIQEYGSYLHHFLVNTVIPKRFLEMKKKKKKNIKLIENKEEKLNG